MTRPELELAPPRACGLKTAGSGSVIFMALLYTNRVKETPMQFPGSYLQWREKSRPSMTCNSGQPWMYEKFINMVFVFHT